MPIQPTTCFEKIAELTKPIRIIQGGTSAGKTYSILLYLIYYTFNLERTDLISVVAESVPVIKRGAYKDFLDILKSNGWYDESKHNKTDRVYHLNNCTFEFFGADDATKLRGARRDILFINECNNVTFEAYGELNIRTKKFTFLDYNPTSPFWVTEHLIEDDKSDFIIVTYADNEFLEQKIVDDIESWKIKGEASDYFANKWKVMGLGEMGQFEGQIFQNWQEVEELPDGAELLGSGLDYGFTNDPTALVSVYRYNDELIVDEVIYSTGLLNKDIATLIRKSQASKKIIYADSAEPKSNAELKSYGFPILPVYKGKDSVNYGISLMQDKGFKVTSRSTNLIKELQNYIWMKDREGNSLNIPIDDYNHALDATRYFFLMKFGNMGSTFSLKVRPYRG